MISLAFSEMTKLLSQTDLVEKSDAFLDKSIDKFISTFNALPESEYKDLHTWLNSGNCLAEKFNNFIFFFEQFDIDDDLDVSKILPEVDYEKDHETLDWLDSSYTECIDHFEANAADVEILVFGYLEKKQNATVIHYRIFAVDPRPMIGALLWDEKSISTEDAISNVFYTYITAMNCNSIMFHDGAPPGINKHSTNAAPLFKYHPVRYAQSRDYVKKASGALREHGIVPSELAINGVNVIAQLISQENNEKLSGSSLRFRRNDKVQSINGIYKEIECFLIYNGFIQSGKKIFDLNPPLIEMFRYTSVDAIPVSFLTSPFKSYYLYFGKQEQLSTADGWHIDGAYVQHFPEKRLIQFLFTSCPDNPAEINLWHIKREPFIPCVISSEQFNLNLGKAIDDVISKSKDEMLERITEGDKDRTDELKQSALEHGEDFGGLEIGRVVDIGASTAKARLVELENSINTLKGALSLAVNSMCYLTAYPDDIDLNWASETPRSMVERATKGHPSIKKNTESKLLSTGYQKVYLCGRKITQGPVVESADVHGKKRTHWRRFHWRLQPYGPKRSLRKAIIIEATLINPGAGFEDEPTGTIYIDRNIVNLAAVRKNLAITSPKYWEGLE